MNPKLELLKAEFREYCSGLYIKWIDYVFKSAGFSRC